MTLDARRYLPAALAVVLVFVLAAVAGYATEGDGSGPRANIAVADAASATRGGVQSLSGDTLVVLTESGQKQFSLAPDATIEVLRPTTASSIVQGEWLNAGAIPHTQTLFAIVGLTLIPQALLETR